MDLGSLRTLALSLNATVLGVDVTVDPDGTPTEARGIWVTPITQDMPSSLGVRRREPKRVIALLVSEVPTIERGLVLEAPPVPGGTVQRWRVDGFELVEADQVRATVVPIT